MTMGDASTELLRKNANYIIDRADYGLGKLSIVPGTNVEAGLAAVGMRGKEGIGGKLVLTPSVLWFHPHALNRVRPEFGIPLEEIAELRDVSRGLSRQLEVVMRSEMRLRFVVWGVPKLIAAIEDARAHDTRR
jgi:hypothetical protein